MGEGNPPVLEVEMVEIVVVEETDDAHPCAGDAVRVKGIEVGMQGWREFAGEVVGGVRVWSEALEGLVPELVG